MAENTRPDGLDEGDVRIHLKAIAMLLGASPASITVGGSGIAEAIGIGVHVHKIGDEILVYLHPTST